MPHQSADAAGWQTTPPVEIGTGHRHPPAAGVEKSVARCRTGAGQLLGYSIRMRFIGFYNCLVWLSALALTSCATGPTKMPDTGPMIDHIPHWLGGPPEGVPPRPGTPEYEAWQAKRAQDAAAIKSKGQPGDASGLSAGKAQ
jgi:hypothetical protein